MSRQPYSGTRTPLAPPCLPACLPVSLPNSEVSALLAMALTSPAWQPAHFSLRGKVFYFFYSDVGGRTSLGRVCSGGFLPDRFDQAVPQQTALFFSSVYLGVTGRIKFGVLFIQTCPAFLVSPHLKTLSSVHPSVRSMWSSTRGEPMLREHLVRRRDICARD